MSLLPEIIETKANKNWSINTIKKTIVLFVKKVKEKNRRDNKFPATKNRNKYEFEKMTETTIIKIPLFW